MATIILVGLLTFNILSSSGARDNEPIAKNLTVFSQEPQKGAVNISYQEEIPTPKPNTAISNTSPKEQSDSKAPITKTNVRTKELKTSAVGKQKNQPTSPVEGLDSSAQVIYKFIRSTRPTVPDYEAELIAYGLQLYGKEKNIDPLLVAALIERESGFNPRAISKHGAKGLGQLMDFNVKALKIEDPFQIEESIRGTTTYLAYLFKRWKNKAKPVKWVLASYLEGPNGVARKKGAWKASTERYIRDILKTYSKLKKVMPS